MSLFHPLQRSRIKTKPKAHKENWRSKKVRLSAGEIAVMRSAIFDRSEHQCENAVDDKGKRCPERLGWWAFDMHHMQHRSLGGSDSKENLLAVCFSCHRAHHDGKRRITPYKGWQA